MTVVPPPPPPAPPRRYVVVGHDGQQYDVDLVQLRAWASERRITPAHQVFSHASDKWLLAGELPELQDVLASSTTTAAPIEKPWYEQNVSCGGAGCLAIVGIALLFIYPPLGVLLMFVALVVAVVFRSR